MTIPCRREQNFTWTAVLSNSARRSHRRGPASCRLRRRSSAALKASIGSPYVWGGNLQGGVAELMELFYGGEVPAAARASADPGGPGLLGAALPGHRRLDAPQYLAACFIRKGGAGRREDGWKRLPGSWNRWT